MLHAILTHFHCLTDISLWMKSSKLKLNSNKTEFIIIGTKQQRHKLSNHFPVKLLDNDISPSDSVRNLGVIFDSDLASTNTFIIKTVVVVVCFFRLFSAILNKSKHWVKKFHPNVCSIRLVNNKTKKRSLTLQWHAYMELFLLSQILSPDGSTPMHKIYFTRNLPICVIICIIW